MQHGKSANPHTRRRPRNAGEKGYTMISYTDPDAAHESYITDRYDCVIRLANGTFAACDYDEVPNDAEIIRNVDNDITFTWEWQDNISRMR